MKIGKLKLSVLVLSALGSSLCAQAIKSVEVGASAWLEESTDIFDKVNLDDRGMDKEIAPSIFVDVKTGGSLPNFKVNYTRINNDGMNPLKSNVNFNSTAFTAGANAKATFKSNIFDAILYSDIATKDIFNSHAIVDIDAGVGVRNFSSSLKLNTVGANSTKRIKKTVPIGYLKAKVEPTLYNVYTTAELLISPIKDEHVDAKIAFGTTFLNNINAELGYRINKTEAYGMDVTSKGPYLGVSYIFGGSNENVVEEPKPVVEEKVVLKDSDNDGVLNKDDFCPKTYADYKVDYRGCAGYQIDDDGDGVTNDLDKCLSTPDNTEVNADGCTKAVEAKVLKIKNLHFNRVSSSLTSESVRVIEKLVKYLKANPDYALSIEGHTSNLFPQSRNANIKLSKKRAEQVKAFLVKRGVAAENISTLGHGPDSPIASNDTKADRKLNRRVEIYLRAIN